MNSVRAFGLATMWLLITGFAARADDLPTSGSYVGVVRLVRWIGDVSHVATTAKCLGWVEPDGTSRIVIAGPTILQSDNGKLGNLLVGGFAPDDAAGRWKCRFLGQDRFAAGNKRFFSTALQIGEEDLSGSLPGGSVVYGSTTVWMEIRMRLLKAH